MASFYFWQNMAAIHQIEFLRSLAERNSVSWLVDEEIGADRVMQGWSVPDLGRIELRAIGPASVGSVLDAAPEDAIHVFAPRGSKSGPILSRELESRRLRYGIMAERPMDTGIKLFIRGYLYRMMSLRYSRLEFVLAMGRSGARWYQANGFPIAAEFGYCVSKSLNHVVAPVGPSYRFICVAQLIPRKRHVDLLKALAMVEGDWILECIGRGPLDTHLRNLAGELGIADRISWSSAAPNELARSMIAAADSLVLQSSWEGWGAVVNEAIAEGTRVVVSEESGASCLLEMPDVGDSFPAKSISTLADRLRGHLARGRVMPEERCARRALHDNISGAALSVYFESVVSGGRPIAPWYSASPRSVIQDSPFGK